MTYQVPNRDCKINLDNVTHIKIHFAEDVWYSLKHKKGDRKRRLPFTEPKYYEENIYQSVFGDLCTESELKNGHLFVDGKMYELPEVIVFLLDDKDVTITCKTLEEARQIYNDIDDKLNQKSNKLEEIAQKQLIN